MNLGNTAFCITLDEMTNLPLRPAITDLQRSGDLSLRTGELVVARITGARDLHIRRFEIGGKFGADALLGIECSQGSISRGKISIRDRQMDIRAYRSRLARHYDTSSCAFDLLVTEKVGHNQLYIVQDQTTGIHAIQWADYAHSVRKEGIIVGAEYAVFPYRRGTLQLFGLVKGEDVLCMGTTLPASGGHFKPLE